MIKLKDFMKRAETITVDKNFLNDDDFMMGAYGLYLVYINTFKLRDSGFYELLLTMSERLVYSFYDNDAALDAMNFIDELCFFNYITLYEINEAIDCEYYETANEYIDNYAKLNTADESLVKCIKDKIIEGLLKRG